MKIKLRSGVGELLFGMKEKDVVALYGEPSRRYKDEEKNVIFLYNSLKLRLTFYQDEDFRLGYIIVSHPDTELGESRLIGRKWSADELERVDKSIANFEKENFDTIDNYFNEDNWIIFQVEFDEIIKVEIGATINKADEFDWKF